MRKKIVMAASVAFAALPAVVSTPAQAYHHRHYGHDGYYHGRGGHYRYRCGGGDGAVGTIAGGVGGALIGNALGGGTVGTIAGGVGGGLLGRHLDKQHTRHRRGC